MASDDLIDFEIIESQKENIQALPSGRSAKKLAELFTASSPAAAQTKAAPPLPGETRSATDSIRAEYEAEIALVDDETDDPLDVWDRYARWTVHAFPSAQATRQSQLHSLLERATKQFVGSPQYRNDARYLRLWLDYIRLFADAPRETFLFLARHAIGDQLAAFYEEYAQWLEGAGRWAQADEVYKMGIEREARPQQRLIRKFGEFEQRWARHREEVGDDDAPSSPALPTVRPALAAKIDPFAMAEMARDPQGSRQGAALGGGPAATSSRAAKSKMAIFSDAEAAAPSAMSSRGPESKGWDSIGSLAERKKENVVAPKPMAGETLRAGGKKPGAAKMMVFRDAD